MNIKNLTNEERKITKQLGCFSILEYERDLSVSPFNATSQFFMSKMGVRRRQAIVKLEKSSVIMQAGALQWLTGNIQVQTDVKGVAVRALSEYLTVFKGLGCKTLGDISRIIKSYSEGAYQIA